MIYNPHTSSLQRNTACGPSAPRRDTSSTLRIRLADDNRPPCIAHSTGTTKTQRRVRESHHLLLLIMQNQRNHRPTMSWYDPSHTAELSNLESSVSREYKRERERVLRNSPSHCFSCGHPINKERCYVALLSTGNFSRLNESTKEVTRKQKGDETKTTVSTETIVNFTCDS